MKILSERDVSLALLPGDTLILWDGEKKLLEEPITKAMHVDVVMTVKVEDGDLGLKTGIAGVFGVRKKEAKP